CRIGIAISLRYVRLESQEGEVRAFPRASTLHPSNPNLPSSKGECIPHFSQYLSIQHSRKETCREIREKSVCRTRRQTPRLAEQISRASPNRNEGRWLLYATY